VVIVFVGPADDLQRVVEVAERRVDRVGLRVRSQRLGVPAQAGDLRRDDAGCPVDRGHRTVAVLAIDADIHRVRCGIDRHPVHGPAERSQTSGPGDRIGAAIDRHQAVRVSVSDICHVGDRIHSHRRRIGPGQRRGNTTAGDIATDNWTYSATNTDDATSTYSTTQPHALAGQDAVTSYYGGWTSTDGYDAAGNMTNYQSGGYLQQYTWNDQDQLTQTSDNSGDNTTYTYDADGNLLLQTDNTTTTTLYLPDEEITASTSTSPATYTADRYYTLGGVTVAVRPSAGDIQYLTGNQQNTSTTAIDATTLAATYRYYGPFGNQLAPDPGNWPGNKAFVGGTSDTITGLTNLGAREENTALSTFITPDPILTPDDPQNLDPYTYAANNPATQSDPSGLHAEDDTDNCADSSCTIDYKIANGEGFYTPSTVNQGGLIDLAGGFVNTIYHAAKGLEGLTPGGQLIDSMLPSRIPLGNPDTTSYGAGGFYAGFASLFIPGGAEDDAARVGLGVVERMAPEATTVAESARFVTDSSGLTVDTQPPLYARMALPDGNVSYGFRPGGGDAWQWTRPGAPTAAGTAVPSAAAIAEESEYGLAAALKDPQNIIDSGNQSVTTMLDPGLPHSMVMPGYSFGDPILMLAVAVELVGRALGG
jgi:RHS repeat-associated protein